MARTDNQACRAEVACWEASEQNSNRHYRTISIYSAQGEAQEYSGKYLQSTNFSLEHPQVAFLYAPLYAKQMSKQDFLISP
jgi:hypothetical protein